jgi:hypothetical protein
MLKFLGMQHDFMELFKNKLKPHHLKNLRAACSLMRKNISIKCLKERSEEAEAVYGKILRNTQSRFSIFSRMGKYKMDMCLWFGTPPLDDPKFPLYFMRFEGSFYVGNVTSCWTENENEEPIPIPVATYFSYNDFENWKGGLWITKIEKKFSRGVKTPHSIDVEITRRLCGSRVVNATMVFVCEESRGHGNIHLWINFPDDKKY